MVRFKSMTFNGKVRVVASKNGVKLELLKRGRLKLRLQAEGNIVSWWFGDKDAPMWDFIIRQTTFVPRIFKIPAKHVLVTSEAMCPACKAPFVAEEEIVLLPLQAHGSDSLHDRNIQSVAVHAKCYWPKVKKT